MTFAIWIGAIMALLVAILNALPTAGVLSSDISTSIQLIIGQMKAWNFFFPISEIFQSVIITTVYFVTIWAIHAINKIFHAIRGTNSGQ